MTLPTAVLLDLDGTIIDSPEGAEACWEAVCAQAAGMLGVGATDLYTAIHAARLEYWADPQRSFHGRMDLRVSTRQFVATAFVQLGLARLDGAHRIADAFRDRRDQYILNAGATDALAAFRAAGVRLALVTNGSALVQGAKIEQFNLGRFFECILIEGEQGFGKPDERVYKLALDTLAVAARDTWMVGDDLDWDVAGPQRLGIHGIWLRGSNMGTPEPRADVRPDRIIGSLRELVG